MLSRLFIYKMSNYMYVKFLSSSEKRIVTYDFTCWSNGELTVVAGEEVFVKRSLEWWATVETKKGQIIDIPKTYLAIPNSLEANPWYFPDMSRAEAELLLIFEDPGTYLVRPSSSENEFSISLRTNIPEKLIVHYKIGHDPFRGFHIHNNLFHTTLSTLMGYYQHDRHNKLQLRHTLSKICPKPAPRIFRLAPNEQKEIPQNEIEKKQKVGCGFFGEVYAGYYHQVKIAVKVPIKHDQKLWEKEMIPLRELCHKNVVTFYGYSTVNNLTGAPKWMIFEFVDYCLLVQLMKQVYTNNPLQLLHIATEIARGMHYIHAKNFVHRDLAARNILITKDLQAKISDFGLSRKLQNEIYSLGQRGNTPRPTKWEAIECLKKGVYNKATDVWAFGVLMYEIYSEGKVPYEHWDNKELLLENLKKGYRLEKPCAMSDKLYDFVLQCWHKDSKQRPNFDTIYKFLCSSEQFNF